MPDAVLVKGKLIRPDGSVWAAATVTCTFANLSTTPTTQHPPARLTTTTDVDGSYSFLLWKNELGDYASHYLFKFPNDSVQRKVIISVDTPAEVELSQLLLASTPPSDSSYPSLLELINTLFASGDFSSTADLVPLNPAIPGLSATNVQDAITEIASRVYIHQQSTVSSTWTVNHNLGFYPDTEIFSGAEKIAADVLHVSVNQLLVYWSLPKSGIVRCT